MFGSLYTKDELRALPGFNRGANDYSNGKPRAVPYWYEDVLYNDRFIPEHRAYILGWKAAKKNLGNRKDPRVRSSDGMGLGTFIFLFLVFPPVLYWSFFMLISL